MIWLYFLVALYSILGVVPSCHSATNLALGKKYTFSQKPNYQHTAAAADTSALTDGIFTSGYFWTKKTTVGWKGHKSLEILIDLENDAVVGSIRFSTARGRGAYVYFPYSISVFIGPDIDHLQYAGDIAGKVDDSPVTYEQKILELNNINVKGRYILLIAEVNGSYLFCDEIEVLKGSKDNAKAGSFNIDSAKLHSQQSRRLVIEKRILSALINNVKSTLAPSAYMNSRLHDIEIKINVLNKLSDLDEIQEEIYRLRGELLSQQYPVRGLLLEAVTPWKVLTSTDKPSGIAPALISLAMLRGGHDYSALMLTNITREKLQLSFSIASLLPGAPDITLHEAVFIRTVSLETVPDPLVPINGQLTILPGESKIVFLTALGKNAGNWHGKLVLSDSNKQTTVNISMKVLSPNLPIRQSLNSDNWGYLDFPLIKNRIAAAVKDLADHHTNIIVVPPAHLPLRSFDMSSDFAKMQQYLKLHQKADKVLLYMGGSLKTPLISGRTSVFLGDSWKAGFKSWYQKLLAACSDAGYSQEQVYLYPYDEMSGSEINQFIAFASWAKTEIPGIRFFATLNNIEAFNALPHLDIAQIIDNDDLLSKVNQTNTELWLYGVSGMSKSLSPYSYYRLMSWKAYYHGYKGIGFWAYADAGWNDSPISTAWDDFDGKYPDYAVIYEGENNSIISSRRWEAWRLGIEDYELLTMYAHKKGESAAKKLVKDVMDHPYDTTRADNVRRLILEELDK